MEKRLKTLMDVCELIVDCEHKTAPNRPTGYPSIRTPNIGRGRLILDGVNHVSEETYRLWTQRAIPQAGDLILAREAPIGNVAIIPSNLKVCLGQRTVLIRPNRKYVIPDYLVYLLLGDEMQAKIHSLSNGATVHHLNMSDIRNIPLPNLPFLPIQQIIAGILSAYDDLIANNTRRIAILEEIVQLLYQEWFVKFRFPGHENAKMVKSELGMIPQGWETVELRDVTVMINRGISPKYDTTSDSLVINQKCIRNSKLNLDEARQHLTKFPDQKLIQFGDVLVNSTGVGTLGRVTQIYQVIFGCTVDSHVTLVRPNNSVDIDFFGLQLLQQQSHFESLGVGATGQTELGRESIAKTLFLLPPRKLQENFAAIVSPMRKSVIQLIARNTNLHCTRDLLLPKLISGELDVSRWAEGETKEIEMQEIVVGSTAGKWSERMEPIDKESLVWHSLWE